MWVITLHGSPISPTFTQVLKHGERYSVGKGNDCLIKLSGARVKALEGHLAIALWQADGAADGRTALTWEPAPDPKTGKIAVNKLKLQRAVSGDDSLHTLTTPDFAIEEIQNGFEMLEPGDGVKFAGENWFCTHWQPLKLVSERMTDISITEQETLRSFAIPLLADFTLANLSTHVISPSYKNNKACFFAVTQGLHILLPNWVTDLSARLLRNWDANAGGGDSFSLPDVEAAEFKPEIDGSMLQERRLPALWVPDPKRKDMFKGYSIVSLAPVVQAPDVKYLQAMGADVTNVHATQTPAVTAEAFKSCLGLVKAQHLQAGKVATRIYIVYFGGVQKKVAKWDEVFAKPAAANGYGLMGSKALWKAIAAADAESPFAQAPAAPVPTAATVTATSAPPQTPATTAPAASATPQALEEPVVSEAANRKRRAVNAESGPSNQAEPAADQPEEVSKSQVKRPLKRRAAQAPKKDFADDFFADMNMAPLPSAQVHVEKPRSISPETPRQPVDNSSASQPATGTGRLRRRTAQTSLADDFSFGDFNMSTSPDKGLNETQSKLARYQALHEQSKGTAGSYRKVISEAIGEQLEGEDMEVDEDQAEQTQTQEGTQSLEQPSWVTGEVDFVQRSINRNNQERTRKAKIACEEAKARAEAETQAEEVEQAETARQPSPVRRSKTPSEMHPPPVPTKKAAQAPPKTTAKKSNPAESSQLTKDETFLQAVKTATKGKKALDQFDKEFNQLRIAKPGATVPSGKVVKQNEYDAARPDYGLVKNFDHFTTGDFIVIERVNLFRHDARPASKTDFGGPNFKKFKKKNIVRSKPVSMKIKKPEVQTYGLDNRYWDEEKAAREQPEGPGSLSQAIDHEILDETPRSATATSIARGKAAKKKREIHDSDDEMQGELPAAKRPRTRVAPSTAASTSTRTRRSTTAETRRGTVEPSMSPPPVRPARSRATKTKTPIVIEDSDDEVPAATSTATATATMDYSAVSTLDASAAVGPASSSAAAIGRRKRLAPVEEDTSGLVFGSGTVKRRRKL